MLLAACDSEHVAFAAQGVLPGAAGQLVGNLTDAASGQEQLGGGGAAKAGKDAGDPAMRALASVREGARGCIGRVCVAGGVRACTLHEMHYCRAARR
jgi:hypothetical protein